MSILETLCRLTGELDDGNRMRHLKIRLELSPQGIAVQGDIHNGFFTRTSRLVLPYVELDHAGDAEGMIVDTIRRVRESLTLPEDRA